MIAFYYTATLAMKIALKLLSRWEVEVRGQVPLHGPLIVVANHTSMIDPPLLSASIPRRIAFMTKEELFSHPVARVPIRLFEAFPVRRGVPDRKALRRANEVLQGGLALGLFPEGSRSYDGRLRRAQPGTPLIALHTGAPLLPVAIAGTVGLNRFPSLLTQPHITVTIGHPFHLPRFEGRLSRAQLLLFADFIMEHIAELLPQDYRGVYRTGRTLDEEKLTKRVTGGGE